MNSDVLILGGTGSIGYAFTENLLSKHIPVTLLVRNRGKAEKLFPNATGLELVEGDVQDGPLLKRLAADKSLIFHGINYPYPQWFGPMNTATDNVIAAASVSKATILFPGNVYNFGLTHEPIQENSLPQPNTRKGGLRVELEKKLAYAARRGQCQVLTLRLPDFWGPNVLNAGIAPIFEGALKGKAMPWLVNADIPHQLVFTKDAADVIVRLWQRGGWNDYEVIHYGGETVPGMRQWFGEIARLAGTKSTVRVHGKLLFGVLGLFVPLMREVKEMLYLYENTILLDDSKLRKLLPDFKETPMDQALTETLQWFENHQLNS